MAWQQHSRSRAGNFLEVACARDHALMRVLLCSEQFRLFATETNYYRSVDAGWEQYQ
jgi:hypothetical protein